MAKTIVSHFIDTKQTFFFFPAVLTKPEAGTNFRGEYNSTATTPKVIPECLQLQTMCCTKNSKCLEWISKMSSVRNVRYIFMLILISEPLPLLELLSFLLVSISIRLLLYNHYSVIGLPTVLDLESYIPGTNFWPFSQRLNPVNDKWWIQYKITQNVKCFHIVSGTASPYVSELLHLYSPCSLHSAADTRIFRVPRMGRRAPGEILTIHWTCALEHPSSLCQAFVFTLFF